MQYAPTLLVSGPGTGKTNYCIELFKSQILKSQGGIDSRSFFVLPSREHAERIQHLILKKELRGIFNAHIVTINDLTARFLGLSAGEEPSDRIRKKILKEILQTQSLPYFKGVASCEGFLDLLAESMQEFETSLLTPKELEKRAQKLLKDEVFRMKFRDLSMVRQQYARRLKALGLREPEENIAHLLKEKRHFHLPELVIFDGFYHFTRAQTALIQWVARHAEQTIVTLTLSSQPHPRPELFEFPDKTRETLMRLGFKEKKPIGAPNHRTDAPELKHLEENLFCGSPLIFSKSVEAVALLEAPNARAEIEMIADEIARLHHETPWHYSDISLILRKIGGYEPLIEAVFKAKGIPVMIHERRKLIQHGFVAVLHRFFKLILEDWRREDLIFILKSSFFEKKAPLEDALWLESAAFRKNILESRPRWMEILKDADAPHALGRGLRDLGDWQEQFEKIRTPRGFESLLNRFIDDCGMPDVKNSDADTQALAMIHSICRSADRYYRSSDRRVFTPAVFIQEFQASLEQGLFSVKPRGKNRVQVYDVVMALPKEYAVVFLAGLLEKSFPQTVMEDALLKDDERRALNQGGEVLDERLKRIAGERYFFYMGLARAKSRVFLSYPLYDSEGRPTLPSFFVEEVRRCFKSLPVHRKALTDFFPEPKLGVSSDGQNAVLRDPRILERFQKSTAPLSATRLEMFAVCPFKYFAAKVLRLNEPLEGREAIEKGILLHKVLEEFYAELPESIRRGGSVWHDLPTAKKRLFEKLDALTKKSPFQNQPLYRQRIYAAQMRSALEAFADEEKKLFTNRALEPRYFEWPFKMTLGGVALEGKIDRVDVMRGEPKALVVDYKLSKRADTVGKKLSRNLELQLPLYSLAVKNLLGLDVIGGELRFLKSSEDDGFYRESAKTLLDVHKNRVYSDPDFEAILTRTEGLVQGFAARLKAGDISVNSKNCDHCSFSPVCRFEPWQLVYSQA